MCILVKGKECPLLDGEIEKAIDWPKTVVARAINVPAVTIPSHMVSSVDG